MNEMSADFRRQIVDTLALIASKEAQLEYQRRVPHVDVPAELFNQWEDCYLPQSESVKAAFTDDELRALLTFNNALEEVASATPLQLPALTVFVQTDAWRRLATAAKVALSKLGAATELPG